MNGREREEPPKESVESVGSRGDRGLMFPFMNSLPACVLCLGICWLCPMSMPSAEPDGGHRLALAESKFSFHSTHRRDRDKAVQEGKNTPVRAGDGSMTPGMPFSNSSSSGCQGTCKGTRK